MHFKPFRTNILRDSGYNSITLRRSVLFYVYFHKGSFKKGPISRRADKAENKDTPKSRYRSEKKKTLYTAVVGTGRFSADRKTCVLSKSTVPTESTPLAAPLTNAFVHGRFSEIILLFLSFRNTRMFLRCRLARDGNKTRTPRSAEYVLRVVRTNFNE